MTDRGARSTTSRPLGNSLVYRGKSMYPTFRELDLLGYQRDRPIRTGDVIVFPHPEKTHLVVHRVVRADPENLVTRGDNSAEVDLFSVPVPSVVGVVSTCHRNGRPRRVRGGAAGQAIASICTVRRKLQGTVVATVAPLYRFCVSRRVPSRWTSPHIDLRLSRFVRRDYEEYQLRHHGRAVGIRRENDKQWQLLFPYALFVNVDDLPEPPAEGMVRVRAFGDDESPRSAG